MSWRPFMQPGRANLPSTLLYNGEPWAPNTDYLPGDVVSYYGQPYLAPAAFRSGAQFTPANWIALGTAATRIQRAELAGGASQTGITADTDITGLSVTFVAPSLPIKLIGAVATCTQNTAAGVVGLKICDSANVEVERMATLNLAAGANGTGNYGEARIANLVAGQTYTYKLRASTTAGTLTIINAAAFRNFIEVRVDP